MKTFVQISRELGYSAPHQPYRHLKKAGIELANVKRFVGRYNTRLYDEETEAYLKSIIGVNRYQNNQPKPVRDATVKVEPKVSAPAPVQVSLVESKPTAPKKMKVKKAAAKVVEIKKASVPAPVQSFDFDRQMKQIQFFGDMLSKSIGEYLDAMKQAAPAVAM